MGERTRIIYETGRPGKQHIKCAKLTWKAGLHLVNADGVSWKPISQRRVDKRVLPLLAGSLAAVQHAELDVDFFTPSTSR